MNDCLFCKIVAGEIPVVKVYEDKEFLAFLNATPVGKGHTLVIPKTHSRNILETDDKTLQKLIIIVKKLSNKIKKGLNADGVNIIINNELSAGQIIFHTHIHIIPRFAGDGLKHWAGKKLQETETKIIAEKIKSAIKI
ncbi:MAG: HIT domain-containing protein [Patescibacteria group bacterium]